VKQHVKQIIFLVVASVAFTELLTGNISIVQFADPSVPIFLFTVGYGIPVLLIRELFLKWRAGLLSLFLLGLAYGIWNEGILAKTLLMNVDVPMNAFDGYAGLFGINYAWAAVIVSWHAFFAVMFPISISHAIFPNKAQSSWISKKVFTVLAVLVSAAGLAVFMGTSPHGIAGIPYLLAVFAAAMVALVCLAWFFRDRMQIGTSGSCSSIKLLPIAFVFVILLLQPSSVLGSMKAPLWEIVTVVFFAIAGIFTLLKKCDWINAPTLAFFALYTYISFGFFVFLWSYANPIVASTLIILELVFLVLIVRVRKIIYLGIEEPGVAER